jgi:DNA-binding NarL/FixJ family response regulator
VRLKLLLADDHQIVRQGLQALLGAQPDFEVVGEAADGPEAVRLTERLRPDVLILDLTMPGLNGLEVAREVARRAPRTRVVILSMHSDGAYVLEAIRAGALAYVLKDAGADELVRAIHEVAAGRHFLSPPFTPDDLGTYLRKAEVAAPDPYATLSAREREVLQMTVEGLSGVAIAQRLFISPRTVETHRANLMRKLGVRNQKELVRTALQHGILVK